MSDELGTTAPSSEGLSDNAAGAIAYITWIPAVIFLLLSPYNQKPFVKFHAWQNLLLNAACIVLYVATVILSFVLVMLHLGLLAIPIDLLFFVAVVVAWVLCVVKASQGSAFKLPVVSDFASKLSGYSI